MKFTATIEYLNSHRGIVTLTDASGQWAGSGRIDVKQGGHQALYEAGYRDAAQRAACRGGSLERFRVEE